MSDVPKPLDLDSIRGPTSEAVELLKAEVKRLREALDGLVKINAEDFPGGEDGRIRWEAYPVTFEYAKVYRAALVALGKEAP